MASDEWTPLLTILQEHFNPREEGWAWLAPHGDTPGGVVAQIEGAYDDPLITARSLANILRSCDADGALLAICRWDGQPTESDRELWRMLRADATVEELGDMVVFNERQAWSMREEDASAA